MRVLLAAFAFLAVLGGAHGQMLINGQAPVTITGAPPPMPFVRLGDAFAMPVTTTPQTFAIVQPAGTQSYRGVNGCPVDVAIKSVTATAPITTQAATYNSQSIPGVLAVTSQSDSVSQFVGTVFLGRTAETLGSSPNPMPGATRYISIMALSDPGGPCLFRLGYGNGG